MLLIVLLVRSYWYLDDVFCQPGLRYGLRFFSLRGGAYITLRDYDSTIGAFYANLLSSATHSDDGSQVRERRQIAGEST